MRLILASTSPTRKTMLKNAGLDVEALAPGVDETALQRSMPQASGETLARALAEAKALAVSSRDPEALVIGADQVLDCAGRLYAKPKDLAEAGQHLRALRAKTHHLVSAAVFARAGKIVWQDLSRATMTMRDFSDAFVDDYLAAMGDSATKTVGAYEIEGLGAQLFSRIDGDHFAILGLPLLPLLAALRREGALAR